MEKNILLLIIILSINCTQKKQKTKIDKNWTEFKTKDSIPLLLRQVIKKINHGDSLIANTRESFNATDVRFDSLPNRQLSLLANKNNKWRLTYIQGGIGKHYVFTQCKIEKDSIFDFRITTSNLKLENNDSIEKYLSNQRLKPKKLKIIME